jgi:hypothetical protein
LQNYVLSKAHKDEHCAKHCIKLDEKSSNLQNVIHVLIACRKSQFIAKIRTSDYNWLIEKGRHE